MTETGLCMTVKKKKSSDFCNRKYNKQTKVNELLAFPYERQRRQTVFPNPLVCNTNAFDSLLHHIQIIYRFHRYAKGHVMMTDLQLFNLIIIST